MKLVDWLLVVLMTLVAIFVYHNVFVKSVTKRACLIYVVDLDRLIDEERQKAILEAMRGRRPSSAQVAEEVRRKLGVLLGEVPPNAIVLDKAVVLKGGVLLNGRKSRH